MDEFDDSDEMSSIRTEHLCDDNSVDSIRSKDESFGVLNEADKPIDDESSDSNNDIFVEINSANRFGFR